MSGLSVGRLNNIKIKKYSDEFRYNECLITKENFQEGELHISIEHSIPPEWVQQGPTRCKGISKKGAEQITKTFSNISKNQVRAIKENKSIIKIYSNKYQRICPVCYKRIPHSKNILKIRTKKLSIHTTCLQGLINEIKRNLEAIDDKETTVLLGLTDN
jgi:hypothetical protein